MPHLEKEGILKTLSLLLTFLVSWNSFAISDQEALELGMTPIEQVSKDHKSSAFQPNLDQLLDKASVVVVVNKGIRTNTYRQGQTLTIYVDGAYYADFDISSGTEKMIVTTSGRQYLATTPVGIYRPTRAYTDYMSKTFLSAPMTWAIFFVGGIATHSTTFSNYEKLGKRASGGCVRMRFEDARELNELIVARGEPHFRTVDQSESVDGSLLKRVMYVNRDRFPQVERKTGNFQNTQMWTYDALIVVVD